MQLSKMSHDPKTRYYMETLDEDNVRKESRLIEYASFGQRLLAHIVDCLVMVIPVGGMVYYGYREKNLIIMIICIVISALYKPIMEGTYSATLGKMALKIKMIDSNHIGLSLKQSFAKNGIYIIGNIFSIFSMYWAFGYDPFLDATNILEALEASEDSPYELITNIWDILIIISVLFMLKSDKKQTLHDKIANTFCVRIR